MESYAYELTASASTGFVIKKKNLINSIDNNNVAFSNIANSPTSWKNEK